MPKGKEGLQALALERIYRLFELAAKQPAKHPERSKRYIELARAVGKRNNVRIPQELKTKFCKKCNAFLKRGGNAEIKKEGPLVVVRCKECGFERKTGKKPE